MEIAGILITATETTTKVVAKAETCEIEMRQPFLLRLSDALSPLANPAETQGEARRLLREHFDLGWRYHVEFDEFRHHGRQDPQRRRAPSPALARRRS